MKKKISIVTSCWNERENIPLFYDRCLKVLENFPQYDLEFVVSDNLSTDGTREVLREIAARDPRFKVILNANNFGHIRSPYNAFRNASGDAVVILCSDLQEPPEVIAEFIRKWEEGYKVVAGVRSGTDSSHIMEWFRSIYYSVLKRLSSGQQMIPKFTGFGLYDRAAVDALVSFQEPYPYFRGMVSEIGFPQTQVLFHQERRGHGKSKNNFFTLYDIGMTGIVNYSKLPLRMATFTGFILAIISFIIALVYLVMKLLYWDTFNFGLAPLMIGMFFFGAVQLIFIGLVGEYVGAIWTQVKNRPLVIEEERLNFDR